MDRRHKDSVSSTTKLLNEPSYPRLNQNSRLQPGNVFFSCLPNNMRRREEDNIKQKEIITPGLNTNLANHQGRFKGPDLATLQTNKYQMDNASRQLEKASPESQESNDEKTRNRTKDGGLFHECKRRYRDLLFESAVREMVDDSADEDNTEFLTKMSNDEVNVNHPFAMPLNSQDTQCKLPCELQREGSLESSSVQHNSQTSQRIKHLGSNNTFDSDGYIIVEDGTNSTNTSDINTSSSITDKKMRIKEEDRQTNFREQMVYNSFNYDRLLVTKKMIIFLIVAISVLIVCLMLVLPVIFVMLNVSYSQDDSTNEPKHLVTNSQLLKEIDEMKEYFTGKIETCMSCDDMYLSRSESYEKNGLCCLTDRKIIVQRMLQKFEDTNKTMKRGLANLKTVVYNMASNTSNSTALISFHSLVDQTRQVKAAVHLLGSYRGGGGITWYNEAAPSSIALSRDARKVTVSSDGNYFLYAKVVFDISYSRNLNGTMSYRIYQDSGHRGTKTLENNQRTFDKRVNRAEHHLTVQRVVYLTRGDAVFLHFDAQSRDTVSKKKNIHEFGMFEI